MRNVFRASYNHPILDPRKTILIKSRDFPQSLEANFRVGKRDRCLQKVHMFSSLSRADGLQRKSRLLSNGNRGLFPQE
jgi:hypothetical protein